MRLLSPDFESGASANSATPAWTRLNRLELVSVDGYEFLKYLNRRQNVQAGDFFTNKWLIAVVVMRLASTNQAA